MLALSSAGRNIKSKSAMLALLSGKFPKFWVRLYWVVAIIPDAGLFSSAWELRDILEVKCPLMFVPVENDRDNNKGYKPDYDWVQCNKCRKWRILDPSFNSENLPDDWFCYMPPFKGSCSIPEEKVEPGIITVGAKRSTGGFITARHLRPVKEEGNETPVHDSIVMNSRDHPVSNTLTSEGDIAKGGPVCRSFVVDTRRFEESEGNSLDHGSYCDVPQFQLLERDGV
eukprot:Gb_09119 [translate_table: standard]